MPHQLAPRSGLAPFVWAAAIALGMLGATTHASAEPDASEGSVAEPKAPAPPGFSRILTWDWCGGLQGSLPLRQGERVLDEAEVATVTSAYTAIFLAPGQCGTDEPFGLLDVTNAAGELHYVVSTSACFTDFEGRISVDFTPYFELLETVQELVAE